jgi:hypothetical protein
MGATQNATSHGECCDIGYFIDIADSSRFEESEFEDSEGQPLIGEDDRGVWWGTERAAWKLSDVWYTVVVTGYRGSQPYFGHFIGTVYEATMYAREHGVKDIVVETGEF